MFVRTMALFVIIALAAPALPMQAMAEGPGNYIVDGDGYSGIAAIFRTGNGTWRISWQVGGERFEGTGLGDGKVLAFSFTSGRGSGTALYAADGKGGYIGAWAYRNDKATSAERLTAR